MCSAPRIRATWYGSRTEEPRRELMRHPEALTCAVGDTHIMALSLDPHGTYRCCPWQSEGLRRGRREDLGCRKWYRAHGATTLLDVV